MRYVVAKRDRSEISKEHIEVIKKFSRYLGTSRKILMLDVDSEELASQLRAYCEVHDLRCEKEIPHYTIDETIS